MTTGEKGMPVLREVVSRTEYQPGRVVYQTVLRFENGWTYVRQQAALNAPKETLVQNKMPVKDEKVREKMLGWCRLTAEIHSSVGSLSATFPKKKSLAPPEGATIDNELDNELVVKERL